MREKIQHFIELWDVPGGAILGLWSVVMLLMSIAAFVMTAKGHPIDIPANVKELFNWVLTAFAASKTLKTIFGKLSDEKPPVP
jgi:hypothetical protein